MFQVGKCYRFHMVDPKGGEVITSGTIECYVHPLVKLADVGPATGKWEGILNDMIRSPIINVTSHHFVKAELQDDVKEEE